MADHKKSPGAIFNVAQRRLAGWLPGMASHKKSSGAIFNVARNDPQGGRQGWQAIKTKGPFNKE
jgi:hypothetical protein